MSCLRLLGIALLVSSSSTAPAQAQAVGDRVRITETRPRIAVTYVVVRSRLRFSDRAIDIGTVARINADTLFLASDQDADTLVVPTKWITQLDVSRGKESHLGAGIGYGALIGLGTGALAGVIWCSSDPSFCGHHQEGLQGPSQAALVGAILGLVPGIVVGGIIGAASTSDRWERLPQDRWHFTLAPQAHGGLAFGASIVF
jgi:hypothetical protein